MAMFSFPAAAPAPTVQDPSTIGAISASPVPAGVGKRARRPAKVFDAEGREVCITLVCTKCGRAGPLKRFGLRRMANGEIRNVPQCKSCRGAKA